MREIPEVKIVKSEVLPGVTILFQCDSNTEAGMNYNTDDNLGTGYVMMVANWFFNEHGERKVRFLNRGVAVDKIKDLKIRWQRDCLKLEPDGVSILSGINDVVGEYFLRSPTSQEVLKRTTGPCWNKNMIF